jgi:hypothetical protein
MTLFFGSDNPFGDSANSLRAFE